MSSESPDSSDNASAVSTCASTYALTDCCEGTCVALLDVLSSSTIAFGF